MARSEQAGIALRMTAVFSPAEVLSSGRVTLSPLTPEGMQAMPWLAASLAPDWPADALGAAVEAGEAVLIADEGARPIGAAVACVGAPGQGSAAVPFISIDPERRYRGLGGEAALALERHLRARFGVKSVYAAIPDWRGLAVYFWLRQGYRPVTAVEAPWPLISLAGEVRPGIWMLRDRE